MSKFLIRFNTAGFGQTKLLWKVIEDEKEHLAKDVLIHATPVYSEVSFEGTNPKWNLAVDGWLDWEGEVAVIRNL